MSQASLYVILWVLGQPNMTMRWANDEMPSCTQALHEMTKGIDKAFAEPKRLEGLRKHWPNLQREDVHYSCEMHTPESLPKLKNPVPMEPSQKK